MTDKPVILLVEDDQDGARDYKEDIEAHIDATVIPVVPPMDLPSLAAQVSGLNASAVILDESLQQHSDAAYMGIDALDYLSKAFPKLPVDILTNYPHNSELRGRGLQPENLVRKRDFDDDKSFWLSYLQELCQRIMRYRQRRDEDRKLIVASDSVSEEFVKSLVQLHFEADGAVEQIVWIESDEEKQIRLIEVNRTALPNQNLEVFRFAPSGDVPFPTFIADVTPAEWKKIQNGEIALPEGWSLGKAHVFQRSEVLLEG
jgi:hypothetical protein